MVEKKGAAGKRRPPRERTGTGENPRARTLLQKSGLVGGAIIHDGPGDFAGGG